MKILARVGRKFFFSLTLTALFLSAVQAQIFTGTGFTIVDGAARVPASCSTVVVSGITSNRNVRSVSLNTINHTWLGDLEVRVYPPGAAPPPSTALPSRIITSPPDDRACNFNGTYTFTDTAAQTVDAATIGPCATAANLTPGTYRTSNYFGPSGAGSPPTSLATMFGSLTPAQANGNWLVCVFDFATPDGGTVGSTSIQFTVVTAASVSVGGRVTTADGIGIPRTQVTISAPSGDVRTVQTNGFGFYRFDDVQVGETYIISVTNKAYTFQNPTVVHFAQDSTDGINFTANP